MILFNNQIKGKTKSSTNVTPVNNNLNENSFNKAKSKKDASVAINPCKYFINF